MSDLRSALMVEIPQAEAAVGALRARLDSSAARGVPAHVTTLFPFVPATLLDDAVLRRVTELAGGCAPFDYRFSSTGWFDERVLYLAPDDPSPFVVLTERLWAAFPDHPPFGGQFAAVVPHLTVGEDPDPAQLRAAERVVRDALPVAGSAERLTLMTEDASGRWARLGSCRLGHDEGFEWA